MEFSYIQEGCFRHQLSRHQEGYLGVNYSFVGILQCADCSGIHNLWINGVPVSFSVQNLSDARYVDQIDDLIYLFQQAQVPLDCFPDLIPQGAFELARVLREPLKDQAQWSNCIRQEACFGPIVSDSAHTTIVIPLYRLWHPFMQGHLAAFSMDPSFCAGQVEVMYVVDDPEIEHQVLNWARIYLHDCPYPVRIISLIHNYGFGMACNIGVTAVKTSRLLLMNSDVMPVKPGWLDTMQQYGLLSHSPPCWDPSLRQPHHSACWYDTCLCGYEEVTHTMQYSLHEGGLARSVCSSIYW